MASFLFFPLVFFRIPHVLSQNYLAKDALVSNMVPMGNWSTKDWNVTLEEPCIAAKEGTQDVKCVVNGRGAENTKISWLVNGVESKAGKIRVT